MYARTTEAPVLLLGAAHVVDLERALRTVLGGRVLDGVAVELDPERAAGLLHPPPGGRKPASGLPFVTRLWGVLQRRLGADIGSGEAGAEMKVAAMVAQERQLPLFLIDDPLRFTVLRLIQSMPFKERVQLLVGAVVALFVPSRFVQREVDRYAAAPEEYTSALRQASPTMARVLLDERNEHMADRLTQLRVQGYGRIAAVVGDAHLPGLAAALGRRGVAVESIPFSRLREVTGPSTRPT
ncbi:MAG TPA: TraB/GumN family protein [Thermoplasmata archaeon]|nr:TraB/GumN family protein [Thermoplasmata archaeon]